MGLWNDLTGKSDADKTNKKARVAHEQEYARARKEEYSAENRAAQFGNALLLSNLSESMAGKGLTDAIRSDYESRLSSQQSANQEYTQRGELIGDLVNYYNTGGGPTRGRRARRDEYIALGQENTANLTATQEEIDRIGGILG